MKTKATSLTENILPTLLVTLLLTLAVLFNATPAQAQTYQTNDLALPFATISAGANSNTVAIGNASGFALATPYQLLSPRVDMPWQLALTFSCPTVTLASAHVTLGFSMDGSNFENVPNRVSTYLIGASASSAWVTNGTIIINSTDTNVANRVAPRLPFVTVIGVSNGNAATLSLSRATMREFR